jgi:hypothetical protein
MPAEHPRYSAQETARRGDELYEREVRAKVEPTNQGKIVAIDTETGSYAVGDTALAKSKHLLSQHPQAEIWFVRIGHRALHRIGSRSEFGGA